MKYLSGRTRLLSLMTVLALLFTLAGNVAAFTDDAAIAQPYRSATAQMTGRGVINGFPDGSFRPLGTLTREQGAKMASRMVLGGKVDSLRCDAAPFADVAADRWSAPCIAWCVEHEILLGYGDGRFGPEDLLTGDQYAKMLLCALELARAGNYAGLGAAWSAAVREDGAAISLYRGDPAMATDLPINRQQAALMTSNALLAAKRPLDPANPVPVPTPPPPSPDDSGGSDVVTPEVP